MSEVFLKVAKLVAQYDCHDEIFWNSSLQVFVNVNDIFYWGTADLEEITEENFPALEKAFEDIIAAAKNPRAGALYSNDAINLFASRLRGMRPQNAVYQAIHPDFFELFNACGPDRFAGLGNPYTMEKALQDNPYWHKKDGSAT